MGAFFLHFVVARAFFFFFSDESGRSVVAEKMKMRMRTTETTTTKTVMVMLLPLMMMFAPESELADRHESTQTTNTEKGKMSTTEHHNWTRRTENGQKRAPAGERGE